MLNTPAPVCENVHDDAACDNYATGDWAKQKGSECVNNPTWMFPNCWKACTGCNAGSMDGYIVYYS